MRILWEVSKVLQCTSIHIWAKFEFTVLISIAPYLWSSLVSWNYRIDVWLSYQAWGVRLKGRGRGDEFRDRTAVSHYTSCAVFHSGNTVFTSLDENCPWNFSLINFPHFIHFWLFFRQILLEMTGPGLTSHQYLSPLPVSTPHRYVLVTALRLSSELHCGGSNTNFLIPGHLSSDVSIPGLPIWLSERPHLVTVSLISSDALPSGGRRVNLEDCSLLTGKWIMASLETGLVRWPQVRVPCADPQLLGEEPHPGDDGFSSPRSL